MIHDLINQSVRLQDIQQRQHEGKLTGLTEHFVSILTDHRRRIFPMTSIVYIEPLD
ncbi:hypothetical protein [Effusibacillus pohliae]|uniref:hypothetical protein n=1 Tax=Effusibacillus pohliae TaxID=232270 RepID=UPI000370505F|nr:hypothetical protein [Effusibacillus pohliae]